LLLALFALEGEGTIVLATVGLGAVVAVVAAALLHARLARRARDAVAAEIARAAG
jgi:hypothetical protein